MILKGYRKADKCPLKQGLRPKTTSEKKTSKTDKCPLKQGLRSSSLRIKAITKTLISVH